ncbi:MAG TPA: stage II sporulation protein D [Firmicutes bacterium]|nr:stage II sporulation protein D [Bacillota bacterium]
MKQAITGLFLSLFFLLILLPLLLVIFHDCSRQKISVGLYLTAKNKVVMVELEEYVKGVVAAEMPANFHEEALKAQAVAARTVTVKRLKRFGGRGYADKAEADFSDDFRDGQAWLSRKELRKKWGFWGFQRNWAKIAQAVEETKGMILTYEGRPIDAVYHSTSGPRTENAEDLWGVGYPYLQSVACPYCQHSRRYVEEIAIPRPILQERLGIANGLPAGALPFRVIETTAGGRIKRLRVGTKSFRGEDFRLKLGLNSANFQCRVSGDTVYFRTTGYGHGVGMCQYGADGLAKAGRNFQQILSYYYQGTEIKKIK